jgi:hypothetical protein
MNKEKRKEICESTPINVENVSRIDIKRDSRFSTHWWT